MKWFYETGDDSGAGSGVLLPEFQTPTTPTVVTPPATPTSGSSISTDTLTQLLQTGLQIGASVKQQRQASGAAATRQARIAACGRKPLFGKARKEAYNKCVEQAMGGGTYIPSSETPSKSNNTMLFVGLGVVALGVVGYIIYRRNK